MARGINPLITAELNKDVIENGFFYLFDLELRSGTRYWDRRGESFDGHTYEPRIVNCSDIAFAAGDTNQVTLTIANTDGAITGIDQSESLYGCRLTIRQYVPDAGLAQVVWSGWLEEMTDLGVDTATFTAYSDTPGMKTQLPRRKIQVTCPSEFANVTNAKSITQFDGSECRYQFGKVSQAFPSPVGFHAALVGDITAFDVTLTVLLSDVTSGMVFKVSDQIRISNEDGITDELMNIIGVAAPSGSNQDITVIRGVRDTVPAPHGDNTQIYFANCQKSTDACKCRGMYGNNPLDYFGSGPFATYLTDGAGAVKRMRNYFAGFPIITGYEYGKFAVQAGVKPQMQRVIFAGNQSAFDSVLPLIYGRARQASPIMLVANPVGNFLNAMFIVCEGTLATNATDNSQTNWWEAYMPDPNPRTDASGSPIADRYIRVNGALRHTTGDISDYETNNGIQGSNGCQDQIEPGKAFFPEVVDLCGTDGNGHLVGAPDNAVGARLGFWGSAWVVVSIDTRANPSVDISGSSVTGVMGVAFGKLVRSYVWSGIAQAGASGLITLDAGASAVDNFYTNAWLEIVGGTGVGQSCQLNIYSGTTKQASTLGTPMPINPDATSQFQIYFERATTIPAEVLMDLMCSRRAGAGANAAGLNIPAFLALAAANNTGVPDTVNIGDTVPRWTFNGIIGQTKSYDEWVSIVAMGCSSTRPFVDAAGLYKVTPLQAHVGSGPGQFPDFSDVPVFTDKDAVSRNILWADGKTTLRKFRKQRRAQIPNRIRVNFTDARSFGTVQMVLDDEPSQTMAGSGNRNIVEINIDLPGCTTLDEAARRGTLALRIGQFGEGGLANNEGVRCMTFQKTSPDCEIGDVAAFESHLLDPVDERYYRITDINDKAITLPGGGLVFERSIEAMLHSDTEYDDTAYTITSLTPIDPGGANNIDPPIVTGFSVTDAGQVDQNGTLMTNLTVTFTAPVPPLNYKDLVLMRASDDGSGGEVDDSRFVAELIKSPSVIPYPVSGNIEHFIAVSRPISGHLPPIDTKFPDGSLKWPRSAILVDGLQDSPLSTPTGLAAFGHPAGIFLKWNAYTGLDAQVYKRFDIYRNTVNNSSTATKITGVDATSYTDSDAAVIAAPATTFFYWIKGISKLENVVIAGVTETGASAFSTVASDNAGLDTGLPDAPVMNSLPDVASADGNYQFLYGVDSPGSPANWDSVSNLEVQISFGDITFASPVFDRTWALTRPPFTQDYVVPSASMGTYYFRARVINDFGNSAWSNILTRATNYANATPDTDLMPIPANFTVTVSAGANNLQGNEFLGDFDLPGTQADSYWAYSYLLHSSNTLPDPDFESTGTTGHDYSAFAVAGATPAGVINVGSNLLTDTGKAWPTSAGGLTGRRILVFSPKRATSGASSATEGAIHLATIQSNTATVLTLDTNMRLAGTVQYMIFTAGGKGVAEKILASQFFTDYQTGATSGKNPDKHRQFRAVSSTQVFYVWASVWNLWGEGKLTSATAITVSGLTFAAILGTINIGGGTIIGNGSAPLAPTGLAAAAAFRSVILTWTNSADVDLVSTEIWAASVNNIASASKIGSVPYPQAVFGEDNLASAATRYYWVRHTDKDLLTGPYNAGATSGVSATTQSSTLTGGEVAHATLTFDNIVSGTITADRMNVSILSAINANMGAITAGTITGGTFQTAASGARVVMDAVNGLVSYLPSGAAGTQIPISSLAELRANSIYPIGTTPSSTVQINNGDQSDFWRVGNSHLLGQVGSATAIDITASGTSFIVSGVTCGQFTGSSSPTLTNLWLLKNGTLTNVTIDASGFLKV